MDFPTKRRPISMDALRMLLNQEAAQPSHAETYRDVHRALNRAKIPEDVKWKFGRPQLPENPIFDYEVLGEYPHGFLESFKQPVTSRGIPDSVRPALSAKVLRELVEEAKRGAKMGRRDWYDLSPVHRFVNDEIDPANHEYADRLLKLGIPLSQQTSVPAEFLGSSYLNRLAKERGGFDMMGRDEALDFSRFGGGASPSGKLANASALLRGEDIPETQVKLGAYGENRRGNMFPPTLDSKVLREMNLSEELKPDAKGAAGVVLKALAARTGLMPGYMQPMIWKEGEGRQATAGAEVPLAAVIDTIVGRSAKKQGIDPKRHMVDVLSGDADIPYKTKELGFAEGGLAALAKYINSQLPSKWRGRMRPVDEHMQGTGRTAFFLEPHDVSKPMAVAKIIGQDEPRGVLEQQFRDQYLEKQGRVPKRYFESPDAEITLEERLMNTPQRDIERWLRPMSETYGRAVNMKNAVGEFPHTTAQAHQTYRPLTQMMQDQGLGDFLNHNVLGGDFFGPAYMHNLPSGDVARTTGGREKMFSEPALRHWAHRDMNPQDKVLLDQGALIPDLVTRGDRDPSLPPIHQGMLDKRYQWLLDQKDILRDTLNPIGMRHMNSLGAYDKNNLYPFFYPDKKPEGFGFKVGGIVQDLLDRAELQKMFQQPQGMSEGGIMHKLAQAKRYLSRPQLEAHQGFAGGGVVRNWLRGVKGSGIENALEDLKRHRSAYTNIGDITHEDPAVVDANIAKKKAITQWIDKNLGNYIVRQMGTEADPLQQLHPLQLDKNKNLIKKIAASDVTHHVGYDMPNPWQRDVNPIQTMMEHVKHGNVPPWLGKLIEQDNPRAWSQKQYDNMKQGIGHRTDSLMRADDWGKHGEEFGDAALAHFSKKVGERGGKLVADMDLTHGSDDWKYMQNYQEETKRQRSMHEDKYQRRHTPPVLLHDIDESMWHGQMRQPMRDALDYLSSQVEPASLPRVSVEQALRGSKEWHEALAKKKAEALGDPWAGTKVHKEYPGGMKWVKIDPEAIPQAKLFGDRAEVLKSHEDSSAAEEAIRNQLEREGNLMGHCVGSYCDDVISGNTHIYSLRDAKGNPHVTVEAAPHEWNGTDFNNSHPDLYKNYIASGEDRFSGRQNPRIPIQDWVKNNHPDIWENLTNNPRTDIQQIKGKGNKKPVDEYLPYVQDFVRSGKWGDVGDLQNTGLRKSGDHYLTPEEEKQFRRYKLLPNEEIPTRASEVGMGGRGVMKTKNLVGGFTEDDAVKAILSGEYHFPFGRSAKGEDDIRLKLQSMTEPGIYGDFHHEVPEGWKPDGYASGGLVDDISDLLFDAQDDVGDDGTKYLMSLLEEVA